MKTRSPLLLTIDIENCSPDTVLQLLKDPVTSGPVLDRITKRHNRHQRLMEMIVTHPKVMPQTLLFLYNNSSDQFKKRLQVLKKEQTRSPEKALIPLEREIAKPETSERKKEQPVDDSTQTLYQRVQKMTVGEKVQFALRAGKDARNLLLKDANRQVALSVLKSPKITEDEILMIAQSRNVSDDILRMIGKNKDWIKKYPVLFSLVGNPKTPIGVSMSLIKSIKKKDLGLLSKNRNLPEAIRSGATRLLAAKEKQS